ncbi:Asp23/Gls24 family envelope stress response protein [Corynebacterium qintianiae]|uniref:Asp23/Gls24 family envelope stress response protein n=1 Tax=Corynebacterium qintianiae TaxID=2709392 RepID=UPI0013EC46D8|nr:Asp23/Gls24 family envelope stress response protein [Corynebacterium qintianiae]
MDPTSLHLSERAVERIAEAAVRGVPGSICLDAKLAGLAGRSLPRAHAHLNKRAGTAAIETEIAVSYPSPVAAITDAIRAAVIAQVHTLTGMEVTRVNIKVADAKAGGAVTLREVTEHPVAIDPIPVRVRSSSQRPERVSAPAPRPVRTGGLRPKQHELLPVGFTPAEVVDTFSAPPIDVAAPHTPAPTPLRPITIEPMVNAVVSTH